MRKMLFILLFYIIIIFSFTFFATACKKNDNYFAVSPTGSGTEQKIPPISITPTKFLTISSSPAPKSTITDKISNTTQPVESDIINKLDNSKIPWSYNINKDGSRSVSSKTLSFLSKYDGIYIGNTSEKILYLTIDEGYENGYTPIILDSLKEDNVKAMFFITGSYLNKNEELVKRIVREGHALGNHTVNHYSMPTLSTENLIKEITELDKSVQEKFGIKMKYLRPPMGEYSEKTLAVTQKLNYKTLFWSFHYHDYDTNQQKGADFAYNTVINNLHNGAVLLLHAVSKDNATALSKIIQSAKEKGYTFMLPDM